MSIFKKAIGDIAIEDVIAFCKEGIEEGIRVEYKSNWTDNPKLAREIASFANTYGGILLIGVNEKDRKPIIPLTGVDIYNGIDERLTSIVFKSINPPVFPEIKICPFKDDPKKAVILIRVDESNDTPHRVEQDTKIYIRVSSQKEPQLAPFEEIEWLMNRRKKAIENRDRLLSRAADRFINKYSMGPTRGISVIPLYPHYSFVNYSDLQNVINRSNITKGDGYSFPAGKNGQPQPRTLQDSLIYSEGNRRVGIKHMEINSYGLIYYKEDYFQDENKQPQSRDVINIELTLGMIYKVLLFSLKYYKETGYGGNILIHLSFEEIKGKRLFDNGNNSNFPASEFDSSMNIKKEIAVHKLTDNLPKISEDFYRELLWSFGHRYKITPNDYLISLLEDVIKSWPTI